MLENSVLIVQLKYSLKIESLMTRSSVKSHSSLKTWLEKGLDPSRMFQKMLSSKLIIINDFIQIQNSLKCVEFHRGICILFEMIDFSLLNYSLIHLFF